MAHDADVRALMAAIDWSRARLETLRGLSKDEFVRRNLRAIAYALNPATNPRLTAIFAKYKET